MFGVGIVEAALDLGPRYWLLGAGVVALAAASLSTEDAREGVYEHFIKSGLSTWVAVLGGGFVAGRVFGPAMLSTVLSWLSSALSAIPIVGERLAGVVA